MPSWFKRKPPKATKPTKSTGPAPQTRPTGGSGRWHTDGFLQYEELNVDLRHPQGCAVYDRMWRGFADIRRAWGMWCNPIIAGTWQVDPDGGDDATDEQRADAELVEWALMEHLRGGLHGHLGEALGTLRHGFAPFEEVWHKTDYDGEQLLLPEYLGLRLPRTIERFVQTDREELDWIEQLVLDRGMTKLYARDLVYYRIGTEGDNWEGVSPLRPVYRNYFMLDGIEKLDAVAQERHAVGVTVVYPPSSNVDDGVLDEVEESVAGLRGGETAHIIMPGPHQSNAEAGQGWLLEIQGMGGPQGGRDAQPSLQYHTDKIAAGLIAEFMRLGQSGEGARATADVQQDPFYVAVEGFTSTIIEPPLQKLVEKIVRVNRGDRDGYPTIHMSLVDSTSMTELADYVQKLSNAGALGTDDPLEDYLREMADLPPADPEARKLRKEQAQQQAELAAGALDATTGKTRAETEAVKQGPPAGAAAPAKAKAAADGMKDGPPGPSKASNTPDTTVSTFGFDPAQPRDPGGEGGGRWVATLKVGQRVEIHDGTDATTGEPVEGMVHGPIARVRGDLVMVNAGTPRKPRWVTGQGDQVKPRQRKKATDIRQQLEQPKSLFTPGQLKAMRAYTGGDGGAVAEPLNRSLRSGAKAGKHDQVRAELDGAFARVPALKGEGTVYRGMKPKGLRSLKVGDVIEDRGYPSTSPSRNQAEDFVAYSGGDLFEIVLPDGAKALDINEAGGSKRFAKEREVLLPRDTQMAIESIEPHPKRRGRRVIRARVLL